MTPPMPVAALGVEPGSRAGASALRAGGDERRARSAPVQGGRLPTTADPRTSPADMLLEAVEDARRFGLLRENY